MLFDEYTIYGIWRCLYIHILCVHFYIKYSADGWIVGVGFFFYYLPMQLAGARRACICVVCRGVPVVDFRCGVVHTDVRLSANPLMVRRRW